MRRFLTWFDEHPVFVSVFCALVFAMLLVFWTFLAYHQHNSYERQRAEVQKTSATKAAPPYKVARRSRRVYEPEPVVKTKPPEEQEAPW